MTNSISIYNFKNNQIRTQSVSGQPYFCLSDACAALNIKQCRIDRLSDKGLIKNQLPTEGGIQKITFINEPNLYRLIFRSNKPQAQAFADWVYSEVLPSIRKTGGYGTPAPVDMRAIGGIVCDEQEIREAKNFLTTYFCYDYDGGLKTKSGISAPDSLGEFFMPDFWGMRTVNILNNGQRLLAFSESPTCSNSGGLSKNQEAKMKELISYTFKNTQIRTTVINNEPWFVATDVAQALEYRDAPNAIRVLDDDEKDTHIMSTLKGDQELTIINESGLYSLILRSRKPEAKAFKKFVTAEVLPSIRRQGYYGVPAVADKDALKAIGGIVKKCAAVAIRDEFKKIVAETIHEEVAPYLLNGGITKTGVQADGLPYLNWVAGIIHGANALHICMEGLEQRNRELLAEWSGLNAKTKEIKQITDSCRIDAIK